MTPHQYLEHALQEIIDGEVVRPMLAVERDGTLIAAAYDVEPGSVKRYAPMLMQAFRAEMVVFVADSWTVSDEVPKGTSREAAWKLARRYADKSPRERFEAGDPRAYECVVVHAYTAEGSTFITAGYERRPDRVVRTKTQQYDEPLEGRAVAEQRDITAAAVAGRSLREGLLEQGMPEPIVDVAATRLLGDALRMQLVTLFPVPREHLDEAKAWLAEMGLDTLPEG